ncbi:Zinc transcription factor [Metarhizium rileyi]|uniref:Zinc transcription factor n=1 Tax=Metarhizium rileyi (strain RCEF 4871) TaxID=1649241 RepID=A0A167GT56_METRR|nr:Zinc transcription factor [Metarhizium rileyi RCEF 4871]
MMLRLGRDLYKSILSTEGTVSVSWYLISSPCKLKRTLFVSAQGSNAGHGGVKTPSLGGPRGRRTGGATWLERKDEEMTSGRVLLLFAAARHTFASSVDSVLRYYAEQSKGKCHFPTKVKAGRGMRSTHSVWVQLFLPSAQPIDGGLQLWLRDAGHRPAESGPASLAYGAHMYTWPLCRHGFNAALGGVLQFWSPPVQMSGARKRNAVPRIGQAAKERVHPVEPIPTDGLRRDPAEQLGKETQATPVDSVSPPSSTRSRRVLGWIPPPAKEMDPAGVNQTHPFGMSNVSMPSAISHASNNSSAPGSVASPLSVDGGSVAAGQDQSPAAIKRRSPIACRRCRRMRSKCLHERGNPPCKSCREAGIPAEECIFPVRGQPDLDREYRHPRTRAERSRKAGSISSKPRRSAGAEGLLGAEQRQADNWDNLPPLEELIDGVNLFTGQYFQLGFIPKEQYPDRLRKDLRSTSLFLLMSILSISARLSPAFKVRYGNGVKAAEYFMERASSIALEEVYQEPTLERCQAYYLLSIAQQGSGERNKSYINMGIAIRMAILMQLQREETYHVPNPTPDLIIRAESARRTLWMLHSQDNLHSGPLSPVSLSAGDITALLPCNEEDFASGREPRSRAALEGTPSATENPKLLRDCNRSLFATLMQIHSWWGLVGRRAVGYSKSPCPWDPTSEFSRTARKLREWEQDLPHEHGWSTSLLRRYKTESQELAYLCVTMMTRLSNIVLRRPYLIDIIRPDRKDITKQAFFVSMSNEIFTNVRCLYEQIDAQFTNRSPNESVGAQIAAFCVYSCGLFSTYLCKYPNICQDKALVRDGPTMLQRTINILKECREVWPLAARWVEALEKFSLDPQSDALGNEGSMDDGKDPIPRAIRQLPPLFPASKPIRPPPPPTSLPKPNILPRPGSQRELPPASSIRSPLLKTAMNPLPNPVHGHHQLPSPPQQQCHPQFHQSHGYSNGPLPTTIPPHSYSSQLQPNAHSMYMHAAPMGRPSTDGLGMLIEAFDSNNPGPPAPHYGAGNFNTQLGPGTDGYEGELQFYIDGPASAWINATPWLDTMQSQSRQLTPTTPRTRTNQDEPTILIELSV